MQVFRSLVLRSKMEQGRSKQALLPRRSHYVTDATIIKEYAQNARQDTSGKYADLAHKLHQLCLWDNNRSNVKRNCCPWTFTWNDSR